MKYQLVEKDRRVEKISKTGALYYSIWTDDMGREYVQLSNNVGGGKPGVGTFSTALYPLDERQHAIPISGFDPVSGNEVQTSDNNMIAFLKAVKSDATDRPRDY